MQGATVYTITATNATSTATATFTLTVTATCANGGSCTVGVDTGPGGGKVFYYSAAGFTSIGSECGTNCHYLEVAPADSSPSVNWAAAVDHCYNIGSSSSTSSCLTNSIYYGSSTTQDARRNASTAIGMGMANTNQIYDRFMRGSALTTSYAAGFAMDYTNNGKTDWHLPSKYEMDELYTYRTQVGGFAKGQYWEYWTSTEETATEIWFRVFKDGYVGTGEKDDISPRYVRPVRAFSIQAPAFSLSPSTESKEVNVAIAGYTITSTGGMIDSYSISPSAPAGTSFSTSTGLLTGTPSTVRGATAYTISATNGLGTATATFTLTVTPVAAPAFTLSSSTESKAQFSAIAGYTITSTGGAIASYAISPAAPAGTLFDTSTGLLTGTPSTVQGATVYTITATNATSTATATFTLTVTATCANGGSCTVGVDTGPGGGKVFYYSAAGFTSIGSECGTNCHYLEVAPADLSLTHHWAADVASCYNEGGSSSNNSCKTNSIYSGDSATQAASREASRDIGMGMANTNQIYARFTTAGGALTTSYAAGFAWDYTNNGKADWHLPSRYELDELYANNGGLNDAFGFAKPGAYWEYWTSTEETATNIRFRAFKDGYNASTSKNENNPRYVRPVRAF